MVSRNVTSSVLSPVAACAARCRRMLGALGRLGKRRMRALRPSAGVAVTASAFSRLTRALRLLALLELRVRALLIRGPVAPAAVGPASPAPERLDDRDPGERPERLQDYERPDRETFPTFDLDKLVFEDARPLTQIAAAICRDFGLSEDATLRAQAPFAELDALMRGETPPPKPARRASMDREPPGSPLLPCRTAGVSPAKRARVDARGPKRPP